MKRAIGWFLLGLLGLNLFIATLFFWVALAPAIATGTAPLWVPKVVQAIK